MAYANYQKPFKLHTDASENGLEAILYQKQDDDTECVIAYASRTLSKLERNYDTHKLEFLALKWSITERFQEYLYGGYFEVYTDNIPLTYILTTAKLDATGQRWVASLAKYNLKIFYKSGKLNVEAAALSRIPWENTQVDHMEPLIAKTMLQSKLESETSFPIEYLPVNLLLKSMTVDSRLKLTQKDWIREQMDDMDVGKVIQLLRSNKLNTYVAQEMDSSGMQVLLKYRKNLFLKNRLLYQRVTLKNHPEPVAQFVLPKRFICKVILTCHDDNGHLGMERTLGLLQERFFWPKMAEDVHIHTLNSAYNEVTFNKKSAIMKENICTKYTTNTYKYVVPNEKLLIMKQNLHIFFFVIGRLECICTCVRCLRFKQPQEKAEMQPIVVSYPMELIHLDFLKLEEKQGILKMSISWL